MDYRSETEIDNTSLIVYTNEQLVARQKHPFLWNFLPTVENLLCKSEKAVKMKRCSITELTGPTVGTE